MRDDVFFIGESGDVVLDGGSGNDKAVINASGGLSITIGSWVGVERINGYTGSDNIDATGSSENLVFDGREANDTLIGGDGQDTFYAGTGTDSVFGGAGNDALIGGADADTLNGGTGDDFLLGQAGADVFVFDDGFGVDIVKDFTDGSDRLDFTLHSAVTSISDLVVAADGTDTRITLVAGGSDQILLVDVTSTDIDAGDFLF